MMTTRSFVALRRISVLRLTFRQFSKVHDINTTVIYNKPRAELNTQQHFVDFRRVVLRAGDGGDGCIAFERIFRNPNGGPSGGDGGNGAHIIFQASSNVRDLSRVNSLTIGRSGARGQGDCCHGASAEHVLIPVPCGTEVRSAENEEEVIAELIEDNDIYIGARGGSGGKGNAFFLSNDNRAPKYAERGAKGETRCLLLELKLLADIGLLGMPNAGKSTLLRCLTRSRSQVADYPFTTLRPHIGVIEYADHELLSVADIPGLVEGAHVNRGLGFAFLRHVERCPLLIFVVDLSGGQETTNSVIVRPAHQYEILKSELEKYPKDLLCDKESKKLIVATKKDKLSPADFEAHLNELNDCMSGSLPIISISAKTGENVEYLSKQLRHFKENGLITK